MTIFEIGGKTQLTVAIKVFSIFMNSDFNLQLQLYYFLIFYFCNLAENAEFINKGFQ